MEGFIGQIIMFGGNFAPRAWALCQGQLLPIAQNQALFSILGTSYGGDGRTSFGLPDLRGRVPIGPGRHPGSASDHRLGVQGGREFVTLTANELPNHTHATQLATAGAQADEATAAGRFLAPARVDTFSQTGGGGALAGLTVDATGGQAAFDIRQPYVAVNFIICLQGVFPSRA